MPRRAGPKELSHGDQTQPSPANDRNPVPDRDWSLLAMSAPAGATTSLAIVISGEPWKDPSLAATGHKLSVSTPPVDGQIWLGWSTTSVGAMGVNWQISKA